MNQLHEQDYTKRFDWGLWQKLFVYVKGYKKEVILVVICMVGIGIIDAIYPLMTKEAVDRFVVPASTTGLPVFALAYLAMVLVQVFFVWLFITLAGKMETGISYDIRKVGFERLQELSFAYYDRTPVGWLMARMTSDVKRLGEVISWSLVDLAWGFATMIAMMGFMFYLNWKLALISLSVVPVLTLASMYFQKKILGSYRKVRKINSRITGSFNEGIMGARTTKTLVREAKNLEEFEDLTGQMRAASIQAAIFSSLFLPIVLTLGSVGTGLALWYGGQGVLMERISYGVLVAFISYTVRFFDPIAQLARIFAELQSAQAAAERTLSMISTEPEIKDRPDVVAVYGDSFTPKRENWPELLGEITYQNVDFAYINGEKVLENFNLKVRAGETIALVGETGAGKSTIVNLACRFYEPTGGQILIDGVDYRERSQRWLHEGIGYVLQAPHLFSGTIRDNIRYGRLDACDLDIIRAAKLVNAHQFIMKLEKGYDTLVGEGGGNLSTGEKQLISFARAILANPKIFILDEATSSIDTEMEAVIQDAINKVLEGRTSFIVAHRLSTIRRADRILVLKDGQIIEEGNHQQLLRQKGYYYRLYTNQFMEESWRQTGR